MNTRKPHFLRQSKPTIIVATDRVLFCSSSSDSQKGKVQVEEVKPSSDLDDVSKHGQEKRGEQHTDDLCIGT